MPFYQTWRIRSWQTASLLVLIIIACTASCVCIIVISDTQEVTSWKVQPTVLLAVLSSALNVTFAAGLSTSVAIAWWRTAQHGTTLETLHYIHDRGVGLNFFYALLASAEARRVVLLATLVAAAKFLNGPLLQRATHVRTAQVVTEGTMLLDISTQIGDGWAGAITNGTAHAMIGSPAMVSTFQATWWNEVITSRNQSGYYCDGTCDGKVKGAGISSNCTSGIEYLDLSTPDHNGADIFVIDLTMSLDLTRSPVLLATMYYASSINDSCIATITVDSCEIRTATVEYSILVQNTTVTLQQDQLDNLTIISTYVSDGDLPTAAIGAGAGPLVGLYNIFYHHFFTEMTVAVDPSVDSYAYLGDDIMASLFFISEQSNYTDHVWKKCALTWRSPTKFVINSFHDLMFRAALQSSNSTEQQTFKVRRTNPSLVFHSDYRFLWVVLAVLVVAFLSFGRLFWGWWELGRPVTLSPLETAEAFGSPILNRGVRSGYAEDIVKEMGATRVVYDGQYLVAETNILLQEQGRSDDDQFGRDLL